MSKSVEVALGELADGASGGGGGGSAAQVQVSQTGKLIVPTMPWNRLKFVMSEVHLHLHQHALPLIIII